MCLFLLPLRDAWYLIVSIPDLCTITYFDVFGPCFVMQNRLHFFSSASLLGSVVLVVLWTVIVMHFWFRLLIIDCGIV